MTPAAPDILARIVSRKHEELREAAIPLAELHGAAESAKQYRRDFAHALKASTPAIVAEIKKASPSKGVLIKNFQPDELARSYEDGGASALSVLTDRDFFQGSADDLRVARGSCTLPVLRKDFTVAEYHVVEAAAMGADAILLIAAILDVPRMRAFRQLAESFDMAALVEVHDAREVDLALESGARIVGVNNRDLHTFRVSLNTSLTLANRIPAKVIRVSESGITSASDVSRLSNAGYDALLIGEHLLKSSDAAEAMRELVPDVR